MPPWWWAICLNVRALLTKKVNALQDMTSRAPPEQSLEQCALKQMAAPGWAAEK